MSSSSLSPICVSPTNFIPALTGLLASPTSLNTTNSSVGSATPRALSDEPGFEHVLLDENYCRTEDNTSSHTRTSGETAPSFAFPDVFKMFAEMQETKQKIEAMETNQAKIQHTFVTLSNQVREITDKNTQLEETMAKIKFRAEALKKQNEIIKRITFGDRVIKTLFCYPEGRLDMRGLTPEELSAIYNVEKSV